MRHEVKSLGSVIQIYSSGMVETDKGFKYPWANAKLGDVMVEDRGCRYFLTKEEYKKLNSKTPSKRKSLKQKDDGAKEQSLLDENNLNEEEKDEPRS